MAAAIRCSTSVSVRCSRVHASRLGSRLGATDGLWDEWKDRKTGERIKSCTVITCTETSLWRPLFSHCGHSNLIHRSTLWCWAALLVPSPSPRRDPPNSAGEAAHRPGYLSAARGVFMPASCPPCPVRLRHCVFEDSLTEQSASWASRHAQRGTPRRWRSIRRPRKVGWGPKPGGAPTAVSRVAAPRSKPSYRELPPIILFPSGEAMRHHSSAPNKLTLASPTNLRD